MTSLEGGGVRSPDGSEDKEGRQVSRSESRRSPTWPRFAVVVALAGLTFFVSKSCQQSQIKVTQDEAVLAARSQIDFRPTDTTVRLLRQGLSTKPFWIVVLTVSRGDEIVRIAQVHIDAKSGEITEVRQSKEPKGAGEKVTEP